MKIKSIIVEDEPPARQKLSDFIKEIEFLELKQVFSSAVNVFQYLEENNIELIFLDIQLGVLNGLDFLATLTHPPRVIITTAYADYAIKSYDFNVTDYLLKPYSFQRFHQAVTKVYSLIGKEKDVDVDFIFVKTEYRIERIEISSIQYIEGMKDYLKIVMADKSIMSLLSFKKVLDVLPEANFFRVHNSFIVALDKIVNVERDRINIASKLIPISQSKKNEFYERISKRLI